MEMLHIPDENLFRALKEHTFDTIIPEKLAYITELEWNEIRAKHGPDQWGEIRDLSGLELCRNLRFLLLDGNAIEDLAPLQPLTNLEEIWMVGNPIKTVAPLCDKPQLKVLVLNDCKAFKDLTPLAQLPELVKLSIANTQVTDITPLVCLPHLLDLNLSGLNINFQEDENQKESLMHLLMNGVNIKMSGIEALEQEASKRLQKNFHNPQNNLIEFLQNKGGTKLAEFVIEHGIDGRMDIGFGREAENVSILHVALVPSVENYHDKLDNPEEILARLIKEGAPLESRTNYGTTPLIYLLKNNPEAKISLVKVLVEAGADIHTCNEGRMSPVSAAAEAKRDDIVRYLMKSGANTQDPFVLKTFVQQGYNEWVIEALNNGYGAAQPYKLGNLLLDAILKNNLVIAQMLLEKGANPNGNVHFNAFYNAKSTEAVELLVQAGVNIHCVDFQGQNALHKAAKEGRVTVAKALAAQGCKVLPDLQGNLPLHLVRYQSFQGRKAIDLVSFLVKDLGVDINATNNAGKTLSDLNTHEEFEVFLNSLGAKPSVE